MGGVTGFWVGWDFWWGLGFGIVVLERLGRRGCFVERDGGKEEERGGSRGGGGGREGGEGAGGSQDGRCGLLSTCAGQGWSVSLGTRGGEFSIKTTVRGSLTTWGVGFSQDTGGEVLSGQGGRFCWDMGVSLWTGEDGEEGLTMAKVTMTSIV